MVNLPVISFNTGELSPLVDTRIDIAKYNSGCRTLTNMLPRIYGAVERKPGTKYIATSKYSGTKSRLVAFEYSATIAYIVQFGNLYARFYYDGGQLVDDDDEIVEIQTPYLEADLFQLQFRQSADVMWIVHPDYAPRKLSRTTATSFNLAKIEFKTGPFLGRNDLENDDDVTLSCDVTTGTGILTASAATFQADHVDALFKLRHARATVVTNGSMTAPTTGVIAAAINVKGTYTVNTHGTWTGTVQLQRNENLAGWETVRTWIANGDRNIQLTKTEDLDNAQYRVNVSALSVGTVHVDLTVNNPVQDGIVKVTSYTSTTSVKVTVLADLAETGTTIRWYEGAWSDVRGWPVSFTFFGGRGVYAGNANQPQYVWFSEVDDYEDFEEGTKDADSFSVPLDSAKQNAIRWISGLEALIVGTGGSEFRIRSTAFDEAITPTNFNAREQTNYGCEEIQPLTVNESLLFIDYVGRKVREMTFLEEKQKYVAPDLTALAEHITETGLVSFDLQRNPDSIVWCILTDSPYLLSLTYEREQDVVAWAKHLTNDDTITVGSYPTLQAATASAFPTLTQGTSISDVSELQAMKNDLDGNYYLTQDIDATDTVNWNSGAGFNPVGDTGIANSFNGTFDGNGYTISNLYIYRPTESGVGLFGYCGDDSAGGTVSYARIQNVTLSNVDITGAFSVGALVGDFTGYDMKVQGCHASGIVKATHTTVENIGGMFGFISGGSFPTLVGIPEIRDCSSSVIVDLDSSLDTTINYVGGFVGFVGWTDFYNCYATGEVRGSGKARTGCGGFIGNSQHVQCYDCYATGDISCKSSGGGFVGEIEGSVVGTAHLDIYERCSATGNVTVSNGYGGGFTYKTSNPGVTIKNCYAWGNVDTSADNYECGGFVQYLDEAITIENCYCIGILDGGTASEGGFLQYDDSSGATFTNNFWDSEASAVTDNATGSATDLTTGEAQTQSTYEDVDWNFDTVWEMTTTVNYKHIYESVAIIPGTDEDEVWVTTRRYINGAYARFVEQFQPRDFGDQEDAFFVESGLSYDGALESTFTGLDHLEGETVSILGDGAVFANETVSSGSVTIREEVNKAHIGLPSRYSLKPMRLDLTTPGGVTIGSIKKIAQLVISFFETLNAQHGTSTDDLIPIEWRTTEAYDSPPALFTGEKIVSHDGGFSDEDSILISGNDPLPCTIRAIIPRVEKTGR